MASVNEFTVRNCFVLVLNISCVETSVCQLSVESNYFGFASVHCSVL